MANASETALRLVYEDYFEVYQTTREAKWGARHPEVSREERGRAQASSKTPFAMDLFLRI
jgi:hypothetical protein